jgi:hypothetical protein
MKYYNYSVKEMLASYFGDNIVFEMRKPHKSVFKDGEDKNLLPLFWQYADKESVGLFLEEYYLLDTIIEDDYIAYIVQFGDMQIALLMFMVTEGQPYFRIDINYAKQIVSIWESRGYSAFILRACIGVEYYGAKQDRDFHFVTHSSPGRNMALYEIRNVNNEDILVFSMHPCWEYYYRKLIFLSGTFNRQEYECVFEADVVITEGKDKEKKTISSGIDEVISLLHEAPINMSYIEFENTKTYFCILASGSKELVISVNRRNLICEINIGKSAEIQIFDHANNSYGSLLDAIPELLRVSKLDAIKMHGYTLQLEYSNGAVRNYYLKCFEEKEIPQQCEIDNYVFTEEGFFSAEADSYGNISFKNGFSIPRHHLYYRSYRQVAIDYDDTVVYQKNGITIQSLYRLPLKEFKNHFSIRQYRGWPEECFGPNMPWTDSTGRRTSDIALLSVYTGYYHTGVHQVCVEPTGKYGYLNEDGTWLVPPIYDTADEFTSGFAKATRKIDGVDTTVLITDTGVEKTFPFDFDVESFTYGLCPFNTKVWEGLRPDPGYYYDYYDVKPGKWGFVNLEGEVVVEPKYVYAVGFWNGGGEHSVVARFVDGKLRWGVIDQTGKEVIPCIYPEAYCRWGEAVAFKKEENGLYGLMDFDGIVIVEPKFEYIEGYDPKHKLVTAGDSEDDLGVYSVELGRMITPTEFDCIDYGDRMISCEIRYTSKKRYYDYDGNELSFNDFDSVFEDKGLLKVWKDGKLGVIDWDGNILVPFILESGLDFHLDYYHKGYYITGSRKLKGLSKTDGTVILPEIYTDIYLHGELVIASLRTSANWCIRDTLFTLDGVLLMEGPYRRMHLGDDNILDVETPQGKQYYKILGSQK